MTKTRLSFSLLALILLAKSLIALPAFGEESSKSGTLSFVFENDLFYDLDQHYTNGMGLIWIPGQESSPPSWLTTAARLLPWFPKDDHPRHGYAIGQNMYTPTDITQRVPPADARPYAGWLYGTTGLGVENGQQLDQFILTIGVVGPAALAEHTQKFLHKITDSDKPLGWDSQLHNEPGVVLTYQRSWRRLPTGTVAGREMDLTPHIGATLGNIFTYANAGATLRYGKALPKDFGPVRIQPSSPGSVFFAPPHHFEWYLFAGVDGRIVAHNIFLDGNTFRDSRSVDKNILVGDLQFGIVLTWREARLSYTHVLRTREYKTQESNDDFGAITLSVPF